MTTPSTTQTSPKNLEAFVKVTEGLGYRSTYAYDQGRVYFNDQRLYGMFDCWNAALATKILPTNARQKPTINDVKKEAAAVVRKQFSWSDKYRAASARPRSNK